MDRNVRPVAAMMFMLMGMMSLGFVDNLVPAIAQQAGLWQFHATRAALVLPALVLIGYFAGAPVWPTKFWAVIGRTVAVTMAMTIYFGSLAFMPIEVVLAGLFTAPIFVLILSAVFLKRQIGRRRWIAAAVGFAGLVMVVQPDPNSLNLTSFIPMVAGAFYAVANLATREWCEGEGTIVLTIFNFIGLGLVGLLGMVGFTIADIAVPDFVTLGYVAPTYTFLGLCLIQAVGATIGVFSITRGYQLGEASYIAILEYGMIICAAMWAFVLFGAVPNMLAVAGVGLIIASGVVIALRSR